jgi:hypothetical protein
MTLVIAYQLIGFIRGFGSNINIFKVQYVKYEGELWTNEPQFVLQLYSKLLNDVHAS